MPAPEVAAQRPDSSLGRNDESLPAYLARKRQEISLIASPLASSSILERMRLETPGDIIGLKFELAAALKARDASVSWNRTETNWSNGEGFAAGPFGASYGYQRADLDITGPDIYRLPGFEMRTLYAASGMAALSVTLEALQNAKAGLTLRAPRDVYPETAELLRAMRIEDAGPHSDGVLADSSAREGALALPFDTSEGSGVVIYDTTCAWRGANEVKAVAALAARRASALILVRSHAKLDSLGVEYGRLGSIVLAVPQGVAMETHLATKELFETMREIVRLTGRGPSLAHFPPFACGQRYEQLSQARVARITSNQRLLVEMLRAGSPGLRLACYRHGLYLTLAPATPLGRERCADLAGDLAVRITTSGVPARHAGSFGFDFFATEWFEDRLQGTHVVRVAVPDLPSGLVARAGAAIGVWLREADCLCPPSRAR